MPEVIVSVEIQYNVVENKVTDSAKLLKVTNSNGLDITQSFKDFCEQNNFNLYLKNDIEEAISGYIKQHYT